MTRRALKNKEIDHIFEIWSAQDRHPVTELEAPNPFCLLVAIVLSAQATDVGVNKATPSLFKVADTPKKMAKLRVEEIAEHIKTIGLYHSKAKNVAALARLLVSEYGGEIPETREELEKLPGVGRKTANVWLNCVLGHPTIAVDTHVHRVSNRIGLCKTKDVLKTELALEKKIPGKWKQHAHHWLILHGRYICKARKPECTRCPIIDVCLFKEKVLAA